MHGDASVFNDKDSVERRLLASVCYEFGATLTARFHLANSSGNRQFKNNIRKLANRLFWSHLENLHAHSQMKLSFGGRTLSLKTVCLSMVSMAISNKCKWHSEWERWVEWCLRRRKGGGAFTASMPLSLNISKYFRRRMTDDSLSSLHFFQELNDWFQNDFLANNKKWEAVKQIVGDDLTFQITESPERRLLASLCYDFGRQLANRFFLHHNSSFLRVRDFKSSMRKAAHQLLWSSLGNLHRLSATKVPFGRKILGFKAVCFNMVSLAVSTTCKRSVRNHWSTLGYLTYLWSDALLGICFEWFFVNSDKFSISDELI